MKKNNGIETTVVNPATVTIDTPITSSENYYISAFLFDKNKWTTKSAIDWTKGKLMVRNPSATTEGKFIKVSVVKRKPKKVKKTLLNEKNGVFAELGIDSEVNMEENPRRRKITAKVVKFILARKKFTPKQINALLKEHFGIHLHPGTIYKIQRGTYRTDEEVNSKVDKKLQEVTMYENPLIAEIKANPAIPLYKTRWYQDRVRKMVAQGKTAYQIAQTINRTLEKIPKHIWVRSLKARVGRKGTIARAKPLLTPKEVMRSVIGTKSRPGFMAGEVEPWQLLDPRMLRGRAKKLYNQYGDMKKVYEVLRKQMLAIREKRRGTAYTSPKTRALMGQFPKIKKRKARFKKGSAKAKEWARKMMLAKYHKGKVKFSPEVIRKYHLESLVDADGYIDTRDIMSMVDASDYDILNDIDELDLATLPVENFDDIVEMADALNPMIRMPNVLGLLKKIGGQAVGQVPAAWLLKATDAIANIITFFLPPGTVRNLIMEFLSDGAVYAMAEAFLPYKAEIIKNGAQNIALAKFLSNIKTDKFSLMPDIFGKNVFTSTEAQISQENEEMLPPEEEAYPEEEEEYILEGNIDLPDGVEEIELTEEQVEQLLGGEGFVPGQAGFEPEFEQQQELKEPGISAREALSQYPEEEEEIIIEE